MRRLGLAAAAASTASAEKRFALLVDNKDYKPDAAPPAVAVVLLTVQVRRGSTWRIRK